MYLKINTMFSKVITALQELLEAHLHWNDRIHGINIIIIACSEHSLCIPAPRQLK